MHRADKDVIELIILNMIIFCFCAIGSSAWWQITLPMPEKWPGADAVFSVAD